MHPSRRKALIDRLGALQFRAHASSATFRIAGVTVGFLTPDPVLGTRVGEYFREFATGSPPRTVVYAEELDVPELWDDPDPEFWVAPGLACQRDFAAASLKADSSRVVALLAPGIDDAIHNFLRWWIPRFLLERNAFLLHGAGVVRDGKGYVFFGQSGAGKSTVCGLVSGSDPGAQVLGDDAVIVGIDPELGPTLYSAPLGCGYSRAAPPALSAPIGGFYSLEQDRLDRVRELPASEAVARLLASAMCVEYGDAVSPRIDLALRFATQGAGIRALGFRKSPEFWNLIRSVSKT